MTIGQLIDRNVMSVARVRLVISMPSQMPIPMGWDGMGWDGQEVTCQYVMGILNRAPCSQQYAQPIPVSKDTTPHHTTPQVYNRQWDGMGKM